MEAKNVNHIKDAKSGVEIKINNVANVPASEDQYAAAYLKTGITRGVTYQMKMLTWVTWKLMSKNDANMSKWWLATEVRNARGFHDLVLKYINNNTPNGDGRCMYRFMQIKHKTNLDRGNHIGVKHLVSKEKELRQYSLIYLFKSYLNMINNFENIKPDQIAELTVFTNRDIGTLRFLVPVGKDGIYDFEGKGKRYRVDLNALLIDKNIIACLRQIKQDDTFILDFLRKLVYAVSQPSEHELEGLITKEMSKCFSMPQIFYNNLYKNIIEWFLVYDAGKAPYLTEEHVLQYLKNTQDMLLNAKKAETFCTDDTFPKLSDKLKLLSI